jgi:RNA polymerase sigma factor (sigma-70 family)
MLASPMNGVIRHLRQAVLPDGAGPGDGDLLDGFIECHDEAAFAALVRRHGPMVWGVCRRLLGRHDAEDAFQATFLVLVRKAAAVVPRDRVGSFLYGVAHQTALHARRTAARRRAREVQVTAMPDPQAVPQDRWPDVRLLLDEELSRLPDKYRSVIVLCELEGRTRKEVARELGVPEGTVAGRLARARAMLAKRLARRGMALSGGALAVVLSATLASAGVPPSVMSSTIEAATRVAAGQAAAGAVSLQVVALTEGVLKAMLLRKLKTAAAYVLAVGLIVAGLVQFTGPPAAAGQPDDKKAESSPRARPKSEPAKPPSWQVRTTLEGHEDRVHGVAYSPDGKLLATASDDGTARIWELATGKTLVTLRGHDGPIYRVAFSPDGKCVATVGYNDRTVCVWEVESGRDLQRLAHNDPVRAVLFTPDGKTLITGGGVHVPEDGGESRPELRQWDPATGNERPAFTGGPKMGIQNLTLSKDGKLLVTATGNTFTVWEWDGKDKLTERFSDRAEESGFVYGMALSPDDKTLAITWDAKVYLYDVATGKQRATLEDSYVGCWGPLAYSPDGKSVAAVIIMQDEEDGWIVERRTLLRTWDADTGKVRDTSMVPGSIVAMAFSPDGRTLAVGCRGFMKYREDLSMLEEEKAGPVKLLQLKSGAAGK